MRFFFDMRDGEGAQGRHRANARQRFVAALRIEAQGAVHSARIERIA